MTTANSYLVAIACGLFLLTTHSAAQAGPPFRTDDPETPGNGRWEVNFGFIGQRTAADGAYQVPDFDINYGLGDRIQLKYELPIALAEQRSLPATSSRPAQPAYVIGGLGESLLGVKWRFYQHHPGDAILGRATTPPASLNPAGEEPVVDLSVSTYPQLSLDNPTRSVPRGVVSPGPDLLLPLEVNGRLGPIRFDAEVGYHFGNHAVAQSWIRGLIVGREFTQRTEAYAELYDQQDASRIRDEDGILQPKQRQLTLGAGGRQALNREKSLLLLLMAGRSFQAVTPSSGQPAWIAYVGLQVLFGRQRRETPQVEQKLPNETPPGRKDSASPPLITPR